VSITLLRPTTIGISSTVVFVLVVTVLVASPPPSSRIVFVFVVAILRSSVSLASPFVSSRLVAVADVDVSNRASRDFDFAPRRLFLLSEARGRGVSVWVH
jgi:hypothetical protein